MKEGWNTHQYRLGRSTKTAWRMDILESCVCVGIGSISILTLAAFTNTLAFVCVHQGNSFKRSETHLCVYITYVFSSLVFSSPKNLAEFCYNDIPLFFHVVPPPKLGHLSFRGKSFSISCWYQSTSFVISHRVVKVSSSRISLNLWPP